MNPDAVSTQARRRSPCPIAYALDILGDKWSLLLIRDLFVGKKRYKDFQESAEGIPTNILAARLKKFESEGLIDKSLYQERPKRYEYLITRKGRELAPVLKEMVSWGSKYK